MQHVLPDRAVPQTYKTGIPTIIVGVDPRTGAVVHRPLGRGLRGLVQRGRRAWTRGARSNASFGNLWKATAEINESLYPHVQWSRDYRTDSGGPGQWRGICGSHYEKEVRVDAKVYTYVVGMKYPMPGICGGKQRRAERDDHPLRQPTTRSRSKHTADWVPIAGRRADHVRLRRRRRLGRSRSTATRRPCSTTCSTSTCRVEGARRDYGVVLTGSLEDLTLAVDEDATDAAPRRTRAPTER